MIVCVVNDPDRVQDVLTALLEVGITTATVIESQGMGRVVTEQMPIFAGFRNLWSGARPYNKTIFTVVDDEKAEEAMHALRDAMFGGRQDARGAKGVLFTVPVLDFYKSTGSGQGETER